MAPEILNGEPHGFRIDTWSLGCTSTIKNKNIY